jgi:hypothetical protein
MEMEDKTPKQKRSVRRAAKASGSPIPCGPTGGGMDEMSSACGHQNCTGGKCSVRYVGPTTPISNHHLIHTMRNASHVWSAAIVTGLAVVLTGALGYAAFGADATGAPTVYGEFQQINFRLDKIEKMVKTLLDRCESGTCGQSQQMTQEQPTQDKCINDCKLEFKDNIDKTNACIQQRCSQQPTAQSDLTQDQCKASCTAKYAALDMSQERRDAAVKDCMDRNCPTTPSVDACTQQCKDKYKDDQKAFNTCLMENKCPGAPSVDACTQQCKDKYKDDQKAFNTCLMENKCPGAPSAGTSQCLQACYNTRVACFKEAGSNYTALRACVVQESTCRNACAAK